MLRFVFERCGSLQSDSVRTTRTIRTATQRSETRSRIRPERGPRIRYSKACRSNVSMGTASSTASLVASSTTGGTVVSGTDPSRTASSASTHRETQTHHRSPGSRPGKVERRPRRREVVAPLLAERKELVGYDRTQFVAAGVRLVTRTVAVPAEAGRRVGAARL